MRIRASAMRVEDLSRIEDLFIEQFVAKPGVEALDETVLPGTAPLNAGRLGPDGSDPVLRGLGDEFRCRMLSTGITAYLEARGTLENAQAMAAHGSRATKLYDRLATKSRWTRSSGSRSDHVHTHGYSENRQRKDRDAESKYTSLRQGQGRTHGRP
jgi:hypothetical protein